MVNSSVASSSLSSNDISILAHILEVPFQYKKKHESPFTEDYLKKLCVIAGLGFTTILADGTFISMYQPHLSSLMLSLERKDGGGNFFPDLAFSVANLTEGAAFFSRSDHQHYPHYPLFVETVKSVLSHVSVALAGKGEEAERLLRLLFKQRW